MKSPCIHNYQRERSADPCSPTMWVCIYCNCGVYHAPTELIVGEHPVSRGRMCNVCCKHRYVMKNSPTRNYQECVKCETIIWN